MKSDFALSPAHSPRGTLQRRRCHPETAIAQAIGTPGDPLSWLVYGWCIMETP